MTRQVPLKVRVIPMTEAPIDETAAMAPGERLASLARHALIAQPEREAIEFDGRWITYAEIGVTSNRVAELVRSRQPRSPGARGFCAAQSSFGNRGVDGPCRGDADHPDDVCLSVR